jgi:hypothetical protein
MEENEKHHVEIFLAEINPRFGLETILAFGQTAEHWETVRNFVQVLELLLWN